jgi:hypothetical protein
MREGRSSEFDRCLHPTLTRHEQDHRGAAYHPQVLIRLPR